MVGSCAHVLDVIGHYFLFVGAIEKNDGTN